MIYYGKNICCFYAIPAVKIHYYPKNYLAIEFNWMMWWVELEIVNKYDDDGDIPMI